MGDWWVYGPEIIALIEAIRKDERERCARIVETWPIETRHLVAKHRLASRREEIAKAIRGGNV